MLLKSCEEGLVLSLLAVEPLSPPAVPNACAELVERQQRRSVASEETVSQRRLAWCGERGRCRGCAGEKDPERE